MGNGGDVRCPFHVKVFNINNNIINDTNTLKKENLEAENGIPPYDRISHSQGRASYVTCRASITVEAALVMPLFILAVVSLMQIMIFINIQMKVQSALYHQSMKVAGYSFLVESIEECLPDELAADDYKTAVNIVENGITEVLVKYMVVEELGEEFFRTPWIDGGKSGIEVIFSLNPADRNIDVALRYELKLMYNIFGINNIPVIARAVISRWSGVTRIEQSDEEVDEDTNCVYITKNGTVYHIYKDCTYLSIKLTRVKYGEIGDKRNSLGGKYYPCSVCCKNKTVMDYIYISKYGECYHSDNKCKKIYHNITEASPEDVKDRTLCSKCRDRKKGED